MSYQELMEIKERMRPDSETEEDKRKKKKKEYLDWWFSDKQR